MDSAVVRHLTAIHRSALSRPVALALEDGLLPPESTFFDYGCGRGGDLQRLASLGYRVSGWDPVYRNESEPQPADVVNLGYVVNVIESPAERVQTLQSAWSLTTSILVVAARLDWDTGSSANQAFADGILTSKGTFQKYFTQEELSSWVNSTLGVRSIAAAPGVFYVFRDDIRAQAFLASRVRHQPRTAGSLRVSEALYEANRDIFDPLITFFESRGRPPALFELPQAAVAKDRFGSIKAALAVARRVVSNDVWLAAQAAGTDDLVVYVALSAFRARPKFTQLPTDLQLDVKAFFGTYRKACTVADELLFRAGNQVAVDRACRESLIGKLTREALYVHINSLTRLGPLLRIYEGCGRALAGSVEHATVVKLNRIEPKISYLSYPDFDEDPHPALATSVRADLRRLHLKFRDFRGSSNPPILHRKETLVGPDYPGRDKFARFTESEEKHGLLSDSAGIGTRNRWMALLEAKGLQCRGHRLVRRPLAPPPAGMG